LYTGANPAQSATRLSAKALGFFLAFLGWEVNMNKQKMHSKNMIILASVILFMISCNSQASETTYRNINSQILLSTFTKPIITTSPKNTSTLTLTATIHETVGPTPIKMISSFPECKTESFPEGTLLLTGSSIITIKMGCSSIEKICPFELKDVYQYDGELLNATWSPGGKKILFAADIDSPPMREGTGGFVTEIRLFSTTPGGSDPIVMSERGGFVGQINSCKRVDRILYERAEDITQIYMIDSYGYGSAFSHNGKSVYNPSCSPLGEDVAFTTEEDQLFIKHIGNSNHTFIADNAGNQAKANWSPDQRYIAFSYFESPSIKGTCIASINLDSDESPQLISPCPIPGLGVDPQWSTDGKKLITSVYDDQKESGELIIVDTPGLTTDIMEIINSRQVIAGIIAYRQSSLWIGPNHFLFMNKDEYPGKEEIIVINMLDMCISKKIEIPRGYSSPDWYPT